MEKLFLDIVAALVILAGGSAAILLFAMGTTILKMSPRQFEHMKAACQSNRAWKAFWNEFYAEQRLRKLRGW